MPVVSTDLDAAARDGTDGAPAEFTSATPFSWGIGYWLLAVLSRR
jgi:hypothetical protein